MWQVVGCLLLLLCSCSSGEKNKPVIAVSFESQKWLVEQIAGEDYEVVALLPQGSDPEMFDPDMRTMRALESCDIYLTTSTLGFETQVSERIKTTYPELKVEDITNGIDILMHTHGIATSSEQTKSHSHEENHNHSHESHPVGDPHLMSSLRNTAIVAGNIVGTLAELNPSQSEKYCLNYQNLIKRIAAQESRTDSLLSEAGVKGRAFVVMHPSLSYYARDYELTQIPLEVDGKEATPRELEKRLQTAFTSHPVALFYEEGHSDAQAHEIARMLGIKAYSVRLNGPDFMEGIESVTKNLTN